MFASPTIIGESFVGSGGEAAHLNVVIGPPRQPVEAAWVGSLAAPRAGHVPVRHRAAARPARQAPHAVREQGAPSTASATASLTWGAAQAGVAAGIALALARGADPGQATRTTCWSSPRSGSIRRPQDEELVFENNRDVDLRGDPGGRRRDAGRRRRGRGRGGRARRNPFFRPSRAMRITRDPPRSASSSRSTRRSRRPGTPCPRRSFGATIVRVETDEGVVGIGSGDTMDGFEAFAHLFLGEDPLRDRPARPGARDHRLPRRALLAARGRAVGHRRQGRRAAGRRACSAGAIDAIPAYASCGELLAPGARADVALRLREEGFRAIKIRVDPRRLAGRDRGGARRARGRRRRRWTSWSTSTRAGGWPATSRRPLDPVAARARR